MMRARSQQPHWKPGGGGNRSTSATIISQIRGSSTRPLTMKLHEYSTDELSSNFTQFHTDFAAQVLISRLDGVSEVEDFFFFSLLSDFFLVFLLNTSNFFSFLFADMSNCNLVIFVF